MYLLESAARHRLCTLLNRVDTPVQPINTLVHGTELSGADQLELVELLVVSGDVALLRKIHIQR